MRVLIVEDDFGSATATRLYLTGLGHDVVVVLSATSAILINSTMSFDVAVVDYCLPDFDGGKLVDFYKEKNIPTIVYSGCDKSDICGKCNESNYIIQKPDIHGLVDSLCSIEHFIKDQENG